MFPAIRSAIKEIRDGFGTEPITLDLKEASTEWYARNGFYRLHELHTDYGPTWSGASVTPQSAQNHSVVWACERIISESIAFMPLALMRETPTGKFPANGGEVAAHPMYQALHNAPNDEMTAMGYRETLTAHCVLGGNAYSQIIRRSGTGTAYELYPLLPTQVTPDRDKEKRLVYVVKEGNAAERAYTVERGKPHDILHIRGLGYDGIKGYSVVTMARQSIGTAQSADKYAAKFFGTGGRQPGFFEVANRWKTTQDADRFREDMDKVYGNSDSFHKIVLLEPGITFKTAGWSPQDSQFLETRNFEIPEICRWFLISPHLVGDLSRATFCLPGDAEVYTEEGPKRIDQVRVGESVWSRGDGGWVLSTVARSACTGYDDILTIKTTNRTIRLNARHRVLARVKRLVGAAIGAPVRKGQHPIEWSNEWIPAGELGVGDSIITLGSIPTAGVDEIPSGRTNSEEFLEFCGLLLGDGNISTVHGEPVGVQIARAGTASYMDHYRAAMRSMFSRTNGDPVRLTEEDRQTKFKSVAVARELTLLGLCGNARTKRVPGWIFGMSERYRLALLRGFLDADGSVDKLGRISFSSCNREMLSQIRHLCMSCGIPVTNLREQRGQSKLPNGRIIEFRQHNFTCSDPRANLRIGSHTPEYIRRMRAGKPFNRKARNYPRYGGNGFNEAGCELARIKSIERSAIHEPVYDLEVAGTHSFIADGVVVHNSNIEHLALQFVKMTLTAWITRWEQELWRCVLTPEEKSRGYYFKHNVNGLLRGDFASRMAGYATALQNGHKNVDEVRDLEDLNPLPNGAGKAYHIQLNMATVPGTGTPMAAEQAMLARNQAAKKPAA